MTDPTHLYHGTSGRRARAILKNGLTPRFAFKSQWDHAPSRPDHVYLTDAYAIHFGKCAAGNEPRRYPAAVFRVDVERLKTSNLYVDEDTLEQVNRANDEKAGTSGKTMLERTAFYRDSWASLDVARAWQAGLRAMGNCSHYLGIETAFISAVAIIPPRSPLWLASDPQITMANYRILGPYYRALSAYPFEQLEAVKRERDAMTEVERFVSASYLDILDDVELCMTDVTVVTRPAKGWAAGAISKAVAAAEKIRR